MAVPEIVRNKALAVGADSWLRDLPGLVASLEREWAVTVGPAFGDATEAFVAAAALADGTPAVVKLVVPRDFGAAGHEITALAGDPRLRSRWLARRCGLDAAAIWEWGVVERVSTGLLLTRVGLPLAGREMLAAADYVCGA